MYDYFLFQSKSGPFSIWIRNPVYLHLNPKPVNIRIRECDKGYDMSNIQSNPIHLHLY
jgi:hypothetical protein